MNSNFFNNIDTPLKEKFKGIAGNMNGSGVKMYLL